MDTVDPDLDLLRSFRAADAVPTPGLRQRIEEELAQAIDADVAAQRAPHPAQRQAVTRWRWRELFEPGRLARPAMVAGAAASLAIGMVAVGSMGDRDPLTSASSRSSSTQASTNVLDGAAATLFGASSASSTTPPVGIINGTEDAADAIAAIAADEQDDTASDTLASLSRDPDDLRELIRSAALEQSGSDVGDRTAFVLAMGLVADEGLPADLRAAVVRSLDGVRGIDPAGRVRDAIGREGILLSHFDAVSGVRDQFVLDPDGGNLLERRSFTTAYVDPGCPPGTFTDYGLYDDGVPVVPAQLPMLAWPDVVPSCDPA